ncbi:MAG: hypothetical protein AAGD92_01510 [Pseudomonadota bacterium]
MSPEIKEDASQQDAGGAETDAPGASFQSLGASIGARNLLIIIFTMPLVFLAIIMGVIAMSRGGPEDVANADAAASPAAAIESATPPPATSRNRTPDSAPTARAAAAAAGLPMEAAVGAISLDGDRLAVRIDGPNGAEVVIYDWRLNQVVQRVPVSALGGVAE